jgi:hypothetical protein
MAAPAGTSIGWRTLNRPTSSAIRCMAGHFSPGAGYACAALCPEFNGQVQRWGKQNLGFVESRRYVRVHRLSYPAFRSRPTESSWNPEDRVVCKCQSESWSRRLAVIKHRVELRRGGGVGSERAALPALAWSLPDQRGRRG